jgi:hypothetical protein
MLEQVGTHILPLPTQVTADQLMDALRDGHGYTWTVLVKEPKLWAHGNPPPSDMPELLVMGRILVVEGSQDYISRLNRVLEVLTRTTKTRGGF